ncbi:MAG TPA: ribosome maturation factor RimM [Geobacteraceae bacterium]|nr:ribosome maturation factor RimM [Geobacteraceae bacterium]
MVHKNKLILIGKVTATHGIRGQLRAVSFSGETDNFLSQRTLILKGSNGESDTFEVANSSLHGKRVLLTLKSLDDINKVEYLVGREIYVERGQLPEPSEGEYYWCDLIGLKVLTVQGEYLGRLSDILATGSNDIYIVRNGEKEYLIPAIEDVVTEIDLNESVMIVDPPEGLLDL